VTGTAGIVVAAHRAGLVAGVRDTLDLMRREGYYLSDALLDEAARQAGE
jgi:predicted nucleic acid-binding protein